MNLREALDQVRGQYERDRTQVEEDYRLRLATVEKTYERRVREVYENATDNQYFNHRIFRSLLMELRLKGYAVIANNDEYHYRMNENTRALISQQVDVPTSLNRREDDLLVSVYGFDVRIDNTLGGGMIEFANADGSVVATAQWSTESAKK